MAVTTSMQGRTVLITGATDGIGRETARALARQGAALIIHGRNADRCEAVRREILRDHPRASVEIEAADLSSLAEVRSLAGRIRARFPSLHVLMNNAGVYMTHRTLSADGVEMTFAVNHLSHFLLTLLLLDVLKRSAPARVITVSSIAHTRGILDLAHLAGEKKFDAYGAYAMSKLANILFTVELAGRLNGAGVTVNCLHPGVIRTKLLHEGFPSMEGGALADGALTPVFLATAPAVAGISGKYFVNGKEQRSSGDSTDPRIRRELWKLSEQLTGITFP
jgi:NAD(P)-dependent dehydrogenase (short-subunit alcohol dehydrogenase family)